ncbi:MAG TPA: multicopper oxidase domain-containing protein [Ilumatobacteraceae bacterium]|nr:multicopper oxidase domain-containing protein [Ilumatobacteraceae bacterium]
MEALGGLSTTAAASGLAATDESRIPHYFGPYANWANSPQAIPNAVVTVDPRTGAITGIEVTVPGSGFVTSPNITITAPGAHQEPFAEAAATAELADGALQSVIVVGRGFGYTHPVVTFTGGDPLTAATGEASGGVDNLVLVDGGTEYQDRAIVEISKPDLADGEQATAVATLDAFGTVSSLTLVDHGSGYTKAPTVRVLDAMADNPTGAIVVATIDVGSIAITPRAGYASTPTVEITDSDGGTGHDAFATANAAILGVVSAINVTDPGSGYLTPGLRKFIDTLPGLDAEGANNLGTYIPVGVPDTTTYPGSDYYEIGLVQYTHKFHSSLPPTLLRGYVQLSTNVVPGEHVPLVNENVGLDSDADEPVLLPNGQRAYGVTAPSYLGPTIIATKDRPVRILFRNLLPTGSGGDLFLPVDTTLMGAGSGPAVTGTLSDQIGAMTIDENGSPLMVGSNGMPMETVNEGTVTDEVRNPICGQTSKPAGCYTENRATLHMHGGVTPWISDGTPHQWITPAGGSASYPKGVSVSNVPDMPDPGPGAQTFFYTNQQSARLMFYHDHSWGITRLNVYAGEVAGYMITDDVEQSLFGNGMAFGDLGLGTPLIIQDKTFVPSDLQMSQVDPTWQADRWGHEGSLWTPHVYMPAQNPGSATGMSSFGRWMYGAWFWPPATNLKYGPIANPYFDPDCDPETAPDNFCEPQLIPGTPNVTVGMEAFNDTPIVNGTAYPATTVDPRAYRFRVLNGSNDRFWNLQWYVADPTTGELTEVVLNPAELAAAQTDPNVFPTPDTSKSPVGPSWIQIGTEGGFLPMPVVVPNQPTTWITDPTRFDVGNVDLHSLLLAPAERADVIVDFSQYRGKTLILYNDAPAAFPARVAGYDYYTGGPDLSPAGAPTTLPGYGPNTRTIMQVTVSDKTPAATFDAPNTANDRMGQLTAAFAHHADGSGVFESSQHPIIVGQAAYNTALGTQFTSAGWCSSPTTPSAKCDGFARIQEQGGDMFKFDTVDPNAQAVTTVASGSNGVSGASFTGAGLLRVATSTSGFGEVGTLTVTTTNGTATLSYSGLRAVKNARGTVTSVSFTGVKTVSGSGNLTTGALVKAPKGQLAVPIEGKGMHDEMNSATFDEYGRMTANLGLEAPGATPITQNIILYPYVNPVTEILDSSGLPDSLSVTAISVGNDGTQIWKITHNGVDTHPIHFHLFDVQVLNRVTWDGINIPPDATELGWKETVRVSPLEDTIVALRPIVPRLPFAIPDSRRPLNPMMPLGARGDLNGNLNGQEAGFNNTDTSGNPMTTPIVNEVADFDGSTCITATSSAMRRWT